MATTKNKSLWGSNMKIVIYRREGEGIEPLMRGNKNLVEGGYCRRIFSSGGDEQNFGSCRDSHWAHMGNRI